MAGASTMPSQLSLSLFKAGLMWPQTLLIANGPLLYDVVQFPLKVKRLVRLTLRRQPPELLANVVLPPHKIAAPQVLKRPRSLTTARSGRIYRICLARRGPQHPRPLRMFPRLLLMESAI